MLQALELAGFKSFADKTRFEFHDGITVVVGPNGSGKSNVVDAIKWVLGSQSAKSLRGGEMTDVIFNGSGSRPALNTAEVSLVLDNKQGAYGDAGRNPQVTITRRVYRSGEGEYLINGAACRLRDIREMLAGTGIGTEAYSIIEQGKVDALLQASPRDRRATFEEAAGISRFRAKRAEAARRLARVEQNLLRLSDIVDEVESRLRSVRMQAGKAQRYRDGVRRLKELRTEIGIVDWFRLTDRMDHVSAELNNFTSEDTGRREWIASTESRLPKLQQAADEAQQHCEQLDNQLARFREQLASRQATLRGLEERQHDLEANIASLDEQWHAARAAKSPEPEAADRETHLARLQAARDEYDEATSQLAIAAERAHQQATHAERLKQQLNELTERHQALESRLRLTQEKQQEHRSQQAQAKTLQQKLEQELAQLAADREPADQAVADAQQQHARTQQACDASQQELQQAQQNLAEAQQSLAEVRRRCQQVQSELQSKEHRAELIAELDRQQQVTNDRVRAFVHQALGTPATAVADLLHVDVDTAPIIEAALGSLAEHVVVASGQQLLDHRDQLPGGARLLRLDWRQPAAAVDQLDLSDEQGVWGRADRFVDSPAEYAPLVRRLLGRTWIVDSLATAFRLAVAAGHGLQFVTADGDVLGADGTLITGRRGEARASLTRRHDLEELRASVAELTPRARQLTAELEQLDARVASDQQHVADTLNRHRGALESASRAGEQLAAAKSRQQMLLDRQGELEQQATAATERAAQLESDGARTASLLATLQQQHEQLAATCKAVAQQLATVQQHLQNTREAMGRHEVTVAKLEQQIELLDASTAETDRGMRQTELRQDLLRQRDALSLRLREVQGQRLACTAEIAELAWQIEVRAPARDQWARRRQELHDERESLAQQLQQARRHIDDTQSRRSQLEVALAKLGQQRQALADRLRDDYEIDLPAVAAATAPERPTIDRQQVEREIEEIREGLHRIGAVNVDALEELEEIETRFEAISAQYNDLSQAKASLERLMTRLNTESRQLFLSTVETVRGHFQELFRRLFGGGEADIVLEEYDSDDALDCGIEISASPPGKEMRTISLLSGGEKTLTCVALLLAMFRSKPSPFCVLDEVDAALDEANIGRFTGVLSDFLSSTQFVVITHSKKTMTGADTLYGVTMQESGVSKQVSVRFDDVTDDGFIKPSASRPGKEADMRRAA